MNKTDLKKQFVNHFFDTDELNYFFSPGRVNLIGEHIDYNGGQVMPCALTLGTFAVVNKRNDNMVRLFSGNFPSVGIKEFRISDLEHKDDDYWTVYVKGVIVKFIEAGYDISTGFDAYIEGTIPNGSGLSSSASLELLISLILKELNNLNIDPKTMVLLSQKAENQYVGVNCGIMDQFAIGFGKTDHAVLLNCNSLEYKYVPFKLNNLSILIMNTNKKRELADSKYNERRGECDRALSFLKQFYPVNSLCELSKKQLENVKSEFKDELVFNRALHAITENERVIEASSCLKENNIQRFGVLLNESHASLKNLYEVTGIELDTIVAIAQRQSGVYGARMTGAGFGGCAIALVDNDKIDSVKATIMKEYKAKIGYEPTLYIAQIGSGTTTL